MLKLIVILLVDFLLLSSVHSEELTVKLNCKNGKCVPISQQQVNNVAPNLNAINRQLLDLKIKLHEISNREQVSAASIEEIVKLQQQVRDLQEHLKALDDKLNNKEDIEEVDRKINEFFYIVGKFLVKINHRLNEQDHQLFLLEEQVKAQQNNLEVSGFWLYGTTFGHLEGIQLGLNIPLKEGLWITHLNGGVGVSPSIGVGWLGNMSLERKIGKFLSIGPSILAFGDLGNLLEDKREWFVGGGINVRINFLKRLFLDINPFIGVGINEVNKGWIAPQYKEVVCGSVLIKEGYWSNKEKELGLGGGVLVSLGSSLF